MTQTFFKSMLLSGLLLLLKAGPLLHAQTDSQPLAIHAGTIWTVSGTSLEDSVILVKDNKIIAVGENISIPENAVELDYSNSHIMPGIIDAHSHLALSSNPWNEMDETVTANSADTHVLDVFDPFDPSIKKATQAGVTSALLASGDQNPIGAQIAIVKLCGGQEKQWLLKRDGGLKVSLTNDCLKYDRRPTSRPGLVNYIHEQLDQAQQLDPHVFDPQAQVLKQILSNKLPVFIRASQPDELSIALEMSHHYSLKTRLVGIHWSDSLIDQISASEIPVIYGPLLQVSTNKDLKRPAKLAQAGVKLAFASHAPHTAPSDLRISAILAMRHGLNRDVALKGLTRHAAEILGVSHRVGTIQKGKDADFVILSGDPLEMTSAVEGVFINGKLVYQREKL